MELLPKINSDFSSKKYWERFFLNRLKSFEWYGNFMELCGILHRYIKEKDNVLNVGCGNSELSEQLYDAGHHSITNIDISKVVINQMENKNKHRPDMKWLEMNVTNLKFADGTFSVALDKGTLDAMMSDSSDKNMEIINAMFDEISRVLRVGGRYICISLAQDHILKKLLEYFPSHSWLVRIHKVWTMFDMPLDSIQLPVFAFVFTKFNKLPQKIFEVCLRDEVKPSRLDSEEKVMEFIKAQQYFSMLRSDLSQGDVLNNLPPITLYSSDQINVPRYTIHLLDMKASNFKNRYGIFIVPQGREFEWLFFTNEGRQQIAESAQFRRLAFVSLSRDHSYGGGMKQIQNELSSRVMELAPSDLPKSYKVPFLSIGEDDIGQRHVRYRGQSSFTGPIIVEDFIGDEGIWYRQLLFASSLVQSTVRLKASNEKKMKRRKNRKSRPTDSSTSNMIVDPTYFTAQYIELVASGLATIVKSLEDEFRILIVGLGGGSLVLNLLHIFPRCHVTAVEIDPEIVDVAKQWFGLVEESYGSRLKIYVEDGLGFLFSLNASSDTNSLFYDVIFIDVDAKDETSSLKCPNLSFLTEDCLLKVNENLNHNGVFMLNVLSRDLSAKQQVYKDVGRVFPRLFKQTCKSDLNEVMFCYKQENQVLNDGPFAKTLDIWRDTAKSLESDWKKAETDRGEINLSQAFADIVKIS